MQQTKSGNFTFKCSIFLFLISLILFGVSLMIFLQTPSGDWSSKPCSQNSEEQFGQIHSICLSQPDAPTEFDISVSKYNPSKWNKNDKRGALNYLSDAKTKEALQLVKTGVTFNMAIISDHNSPAFGTRFFEMNVEHRYLGGPTGMGYIEDEYNSSIGVGTHVDGLGHLGYASTYYNGESLNARKIWGVSPSKLSTDALGSIVTRVVVLNMPAYYNLSRMGKQQVIYPKDIVGAARKQNVCIGTGDAVFFWTGWLEVWTVDQNATAFLTTSPGIGVHAAQYLADLEVVAVGVDTIYAEVVPSESNVPDIGIFHAHQIMLAKSGMYIVEVVDSKAFLDAGHSEAMLVMGVPRFSGSVQTNVNPIAMA